MREIKFRIFDKHKKYMHKVDSLFLDEKMFRVIDYKNEHDVFSYDTEYFSEPMQYTGLKDKNGKEIYEGDICKVINYASDYLKVRGKMYCVISWSNTTGFYGKGFGIPTAFSIGEEFEVIGNIYENPELLKSTP